MNSKKQQELIGKFNSCQGKIESRIKKIQKTAEETIRLAIENGGLLLELKGTVNHGEWESWRKDNINISSPICSRYITLHKNQGLLESFVGEGFKSIESACKYISEVRTQKTIDDMRKRQNVLLEEELAKPKISQTINLDDIPKSKPEPEQKFRSSTDSLKELVDIFKSDYRDDVVEIANSLQLGDEKLTNKIRKYILQLTHTDKTAEYSEVYKQLTVRIK